MHLDLSVEQNEDGIDSDVLLKGTITDVRSTDTTTATVSHALRWEPLNSLVVDQGPLFLSCSALDMKTRQLIGIASLEKNRFCELVRFDISTRRWTGCTRTRHFRPPKRIGSASVSARGQILIFGGYELSNQIELSHHLCQPRGASTAPVEDTNSSNKKESRLRLFGYPPWWFDRPISPHHSTQSPSIGSALGDFHGYDGTRGEWSVIITRDRLPVGKSGGSTMTSSQGARSRPPTLFSGNHVGDPLPESRAFHTLVKCGSVLYLFGGERKNTQHPARSTVEFQYFNDLWKCDLRDFRWTLASPSKHKEPMFSSSSSESANQSSFRDQLLLQLDSQSIDGLSSKRAENDSNWRNRLTSGSEASMVPAPRSGHTAVMYKCFMYVYGGQNSTKRTIFDDVWVYDSAWTMITPCGASPGARCGHTAVGVGHGMCVYGGISLSDLKSFGEGITTRPETFNFSDNNSLYFLDFESHIWSEVQVLGHPPIDARYFGRLHGFYGNQCLWFGGATGRESFDGFNFNRVDVTEMLRNVGSSRTTTISSTMSNQKDFHSALKKFQKRFAVDYTTDRTLTTTGVSAESIEASIEPAIDPQSNNAFQIDFIRSPPLSPIYREQRVGLQHVHYRDSVNGWPHWTSAVIPTTDSAESGHQEIQFNSPHISWAPPAPFATVGAALQESDKAGTTERTTADNGCFVPRSRARSGSSSSAKSGERVVLDVACINRLQHEAATAWEENAMLREALLLLIPYLNAQDLTGTLNSAQINMSGCSYSSSNHHWIVEALLQSRSGHNSSPLATSETPLFPHLESNERQ